VSRASIGALELKIKTVDNKVESSLRMTFPQPVAKQFNERKYKYILHLNYSFDRLGFCRFL
ncbi:MAG: hypothetical protein QNJ54_36450, partial [Prochloraceae cyanobacterium]|nr:hypothetical protein [Prochloraceae cyanobacterium]